MRTANQDLERLLPELLPSAMRCQDAFEKVNNEMIASEIIHDGKDPIGLISYTECKLGIGTDDYTTVLDRRPLIDFAFFKEDVPLKRIEDTIRDVESRLKGRIFAKAQTAQERLVYRMNGYRKMAYCSNCEKRKQGCNNGEIYTKAL